MTAGVDPWDDPRVVAGQERQLETLRRQLDSGARQIGWKVGFGAAASMELMQTTGPLVGFLSDVTMLTDGAQVDVSDWQRPVVEFELAVRMGRDVDAAASDEEAAAAVDALAPAIELANVSITPGPETVTDVVASNIFHTGLVLGTWNESRAGLDITGLSGGIVVDGVETGRVSDLQSITGLYPTVVATVARTLAVVGERLRAGDVIITGSIMAPIPAGDGSVFTFRLDPLDSISVSITS